MNDSLAHPATMLLAQPASLHTHSPLRIDGKLVLSQSRVKRLTGEFCCPTRFYATEVARTHHVEPTESMRKGQLFEYLALGSLNREGQVPTLERRQNGQLTVDELRIRKQAAEFKRLLPLYDITILSTGVAVTVPLRLRSGDELFVTCLLDAIISYRNRPFIMDLKLTADVDSRFGEYCWKLPHLMDHLQAHTYLYAFNKATQRQDVGFIYALFDYKPRIDHDILEVKASAGNEAEMRQRFQVAFDTYHQFEAAGWPARPSWNQCEKCPLTTCPVRQKTKDVRIVY